MTEVRTLLVTGMPGAGRTTVAAATAIGAARAGRRTLLLTPDGAALDHLLPTPPASDRAGVRGVDGVEGPYVAGIDATASFRAGALDLQTRIGSLLALLGAAPLDPEELTELPGSDALALLRALRQTGVTGDAGPASSGTRTGAAAASPWDLVVVDLPAVREAVALLALPEQLRRYLGRLLPADRQAARALRPVLAQLAGVPMPAEWAYEAAARADRELGAVQAVIEHPTTAVAVVLEPGPTAERTLRTARTGLALYGHRLATVVANRLLPTSSADPFLSGLSAGQQDHLKALAEQCAADGVPLWELPHLGREPREPGEAAGLAVEVAELAADVAGESASVAEGPAHGSPEGGVTDSAGDGPAATSRTRADPWSVEDRLADKGWFVWSLPLPGAGREALDLVRRGDELVVDAGGFRRIVPLPSALRRCSVLGAALRDGALRVRFTPDPGLWPR